MHPNCITALTPAQERVYTTDYAGAQVWLPYALVHVGSSQCVVALRSVLWLFAVCCD